jgi:hypothetical protein
MGQYAYRDKKLSVITLRFRAPLHSDDGLLSLKLVKIFLQSQYFNKNMLLVSRLAKLPANLGEADMPVRNQRAINCLGAFFKIKSLIRNYKNHSVQLLMTVADQYFSVKSSP